MIQVITLVSIIDLCIILLSFSIEKKKEPSPLASLIIKKYIYIYNNVIYLIKSLFFFCFFFSSSSLFSSHRVYNLIFTSSWPIIHFMTLLLDIYSIRYSNSIIYHEFNNTRPNPRRGTPCLESTTRGDTFGS